MILAAHRRLPPDVQAALEQALNGEENPTAREVLGRILENARIAEETGLPLCQDCGSAVFFVEYGEEVRLRGGTLRETLNGAMVEAYDKGFLRKSMCHPFTRRNTGDNSPAIIHAEPTPGGTLRVRYMAKGGGSENMSLCSMLIPSQGWAGVKDAVLRRMAEAGSNPCPPTVLGVGIGGTFEQAPLLAKAALFRRLDDRHPDGETADMEEELAAAVNALGIGPMGLGGKTTCLGVKIAVMPCHIAGLPLAINVQCHSARHGEVTF
jgi:fumarate hydratase subunit alpha